VEQFPWAPPWARVTTALAGVVAALARELSWQQTARHFGLNWRTVASVVKQAVEYGLRQRRRRPLHVLGLDEVSRRKGHHFFWDYRQPGRAKEHLQKCMRSAMHSRLEPLQSFVRMLRNHLPGILAWTKLRVSNGALEGMNNKIKLVSHRSFGFRSVANFTAAIYHCCAHLPLPGKG
jgi:hypothetical protein